MEDCYGRQVGLNTISLAGPLFSIHYFLFTTTYSFRSHHHPLHSPILIVVKPVNTNRPMKTASIRCEGAVVVDEIPVAFEFDDGLVIGVAVAGDFVEDALVLPGTIDATAHGIGDLFGELVSVG